MISKTELEQALQALLPHSLRTSYSSSSSLSHSQKQIKRVVAHMKHCLRQLDGNVTSLSTALDCFQTQLAPLWRTLSLASTDKEDVLQHVFASLLRIHDGF